MTGLASMAAASAAAIVMIPLIAVSMTPATGNPQECRTTAAQPQTTASAIPADYLALYRSAGHKYGLPWQVLAGVGKVESDHGRGRGPGIRTGTNSSGAMGPMQFLADTWRTYGVDGDHDGRRDVYDPKDAIPAAAHYLKRSGAPDRLQTALFTYNHSPEYVHTVLDWAQRYASAANLANDAVCATAKTPSTAATRTAKKVIAYARDQIGKPYRWGGVGPDAFDCSGLVYAAYRAAGITIKRTTYTMWPAYPHVRKGRERPGDLVFFVGRGSRTRPGHMGLVVGNGKMIEARCRTCGPIKTVGYGDRPGLVGFARPLADRDLR
jgi:cell wall-associated NlpC family hydrolase